MGKQKQKHQHPSCIRKRSLRSKIARLRWSTQKNDSLINMQIQPKSGNERERIHIDYLESGPSTEDITSNSIAVPNNEVDNKNMQKSNMDQTETIIGCKYSEASLVEVITNDSINDWVAVNETTPPIKAFIPDDEVQRILAHELCIEKDDVTNESVITGNRVVDLSYVLRWAITLQHKHSKICTSGELYLKEEIRWGYGLVSCLTFACTMCPREVIHYTEDITKKSKINYGFVWGTLATGSTYGHSKELFSVMDVPVMSLYHFKKIETDIGEIWKDSLFSEMEDAGKEEHKLACEFGDIDADGIPFITVYLDGGWSKRSYGHSYNASSGVAVIIGKRTKKLLFLGVRNKYCSVCARAANKKVPVNKHVCFRNWLNSSSSMEADIITEGVKLSFEMHGLRYKKFIADGDFSVHAKIQQNVHYGIKQLTNKKIEDLERSIQSVIYCNVGQNTENLKKDLRNTPYHVFQHHKDCSNEYCNKVGCTEESQLSDISTSGLLFQINGALELVLKKAHKLIENETNNRAELFMSILARFKAGKRLNLTQRGSFEMRSYVSGLRYNKGVLWHNDPWKSITECSPGFHFKKYIETYNNQQKSNSVRRQLVGRRKKEKTAQLPNFDYSAKAEEAEFTTEEFESEKNRILHKLQITMEEQEIIETDTIGQFDSELYLHYKKHRLTASNFSVIIKRLDHTSCHSVVKNVLYGNTTHSAAMEYGKMKESMVREKFELQSKIKVRECGIFIDIDNCYLGATPDGVTENNGILEIKCLYTVAQKGLTLEEACKQKNMCLKFCDGTIRLKENHNYYYQIQGQLNISKRSKCYFVIYSGEKNPLFIQTIERDVILWETIMLPKLKKFYENCVLPEIIRRDIPRGLKCVDPDYIKAAQEKKENIF